jgi:hypothetical protein
MPIQLAHINLPDALRWADEFAEPSVSQSVRRRLNGALTVYPRGNSAGRPITLEATEDQWITRADAEALLTLASVPGAAYTLTFTSRSNLAFTVLFAHHDAPALDLKPLLDYADPSALDPIIGRIKLITI